MAVGPGTSTPAGAPARAARSPGSRRDPAGWRRPRRLSPQGGRRRPGPLRRARSRISGGSDASPTPRPGGARGTEAPAAGSAWACLGLFGEPGCWSRWPLRPAAISRWAPALPQAPGGRGPGARATCSPRPRLSPGKRLCSQPVWKFGKKAGTKLRTLIIIMEALLNGVASESWEEFSKIQQMLFDFLISGEKGCGFSSGFGAADSFALTPHGGCRRAHWSGSGNVTLILLPLTTTWAGSKYPVACKWGHRDGPRVVAKNLRRCETCFRYKSCVV